MSEYVSLDAHGIPLEQFDLVRIDIASSGLQEGEIGPVHQNLSEPEPTRYYWRFWSRRLGAYVTVDPSDVAVLARRKPDNAQMVGGWFTFGPYYSAVSKEAAELLDGTPYKWRVA